MNNNSCRSIPQKSPKNPPKIPQKSPKNLVVVQEYFEVFINQKISNGIFQSHLIDLFK